MPQLHGVMRVLIVFWMCATATWCSACVDGLLDVVLVLMVFWMCATATWCSACVDDLLDVCHRYMV